MPRRALLLSLLPVLLLLAGGDVERLLDVARFQADFHESHPLKSGGRLYVENFNGSIDVAGWDQDTIDISGTKYAGSQSTLDALKVDVVASGDTVRIRTVRPSERWGNMGVRYTIRVPRQTTLEKVTSSNGGITASNLEAPVRVGTSNGALRVENVQGGVEADTSNGSIHALLTGASDGRGIRLHTSNGSTELTTDNVGVGGVTARTSNGSITLHLPVDFSGEVDATTSNSSVGNDFESGFHGTTGKHSLNGTIGSGGPKLALHTSNGRISLRKR